MVRAFASMQSAEQPTRQTLPMCLATTAACEVRPPRAVSTPTAVAMPAMSSVLVSARTRMAGRPFAARRSQAFVSSAMAPTASPMLAGTACARATSPSPATRRRSIAPRSMPSSRARALSGATIPSRTCSTAMRSAAHGVRLAVRVCRR